MLPIVLVEATTKCSFVTQTRNIERQGGALALIIDNVNENITNVMLSDDGTGAGIRIPAMLINKKQGDILKKYIMNGDDLPILKAEFNVARDVENKVKTELWYTSSDDRSLDFIRNMGEYLTPI